VKHLFPPWTHVFAWGILAVLASMLFWISQAYRGQNVWRGWRESSELRHPAYTERVHHEHAFRTSANTWSNLAFVLVGLYALALGWHDRGQDYPEGCGYVRSTPTMSFLFGLACCYLGVGSGLFHASLTRWGQQLDVAAMYAPLVVIIAVSLGRGFPVNPMGRGSRGIPSWPLLTGLVVFSCLLLYRYKWSMSSWVVLPILIGLVTALAVRDQLRTGGHWQLRWLAGAGVALAVAVVCRQLDVAGRFSRNDAWLPGHAFWHILTSGSLACAYLYYRFERPLGQPASTAFGSFPEVTIARR